MQSIPAVSRNLWSTQNVTGVMEIHFTLSVLLCIYFPNANGHLENYTVSVYQMNVTPRLSSRITRRQALDVMAKRLAEFDVQAKEAARRNSQILVFPEHGFLADFNDLSRTTVSVFLERVPNPKKNFPWIPCHLDTNQDITILRKLSCMAKRHDLYIVANIGEKKPCNHSIDRYCPVDGQYQFNTNVVFDSQGTLVSRYRKRYLFREFYFDSARKIEHWVIDTRFGRFVNIIGFDLMFSETFNDIVNQYGVRNILYSNKWPSIVPLFISASFHASIAWATNVNLISANIKVASNNHFDGGSGFYKGDSGFEFSFQAPYLMTTTITNLKADAPSNFAKPPVREVANMGQYLAVTHVLDEAEIKSVKLTYPEGILNVCFRKFCCVVDYKFASEPFGISGYFLSINSYRDQTGLINMRFCTITTLTFNESACPKPVDKGVKLARFKRLEMYGNNFDTKYVYPQALFLKNNAYEIPNPTHYYNNGKIKLRDTLPLYSTSLIGRFLV